MRLTEEEFGELVDEAIESLPEQFEQYMENVVVEVAPLPTAKMLQSVPGRPGTLLLGLYEGVPLTRKSVSAPYELPQRIYLFQRNIEAVCRTRRQIVAQVRKTVLHEVGHHFGMTEDDLHEMGYG